MIKVLVGGLALMVVAIGLLGIYFTHKVAGPVFKMKKLLKRVGEGHLQLDGRLRKGDELVDFFDSFTQMVSGLRELEENQLAEVESAIQALDQGGVAEAASALGRLRDSMKSALTK
jgi:nitrogen fixation/metabolism regulation signal transduction histidine kinase